MINFNENEMHLINQINDDRLIASIIEIRQAAEVIWGIDAPRIIRDYTDHGLNHSIRLGEYSTKLLKVNTGQNFSDQEIYLLLSGIYLHDIGMQCDVIKQPKIKTRAEELGANFNVAFFAKYASEYSLQEQKEIRKNHHYLSAAWIDVAYFTGNTALGNAVKTIPDELVDDLMDICMHHAKLPISDCPLTFRFDPTGRLRLVAALLRFSDELDVDGHRVSIETVKNYSLDPRNGVFWWLHNRTKIIFSAPNVILITIRLHPSDLDKIGEFVQSSFITEFQRKNQPILFELAYAGLPIAISADSRVIAHSRAEQLPSDIIQMLYDAQESK